MKAFFHKYLSYYFIKSYCTTYPLVLAKFGGGPAQNCSPLKSLREKESRVLCWGERESVGGKM